MPAVGGVGAVRQPGFLDVKVIAIDAIGALVADRTPVLGESSRSILRASGRAHDSARVAGSFTTRIQAGNGRALAGLVVAGNAEMGIVLGGSGQGEQISANKVHGARAALCNDLYTARMARAHNNANVLSIGARIVAAALADEITHIFLSTQFDGGRHERRIEEITAIETEEGDR